MTNINKYNLKIHDTYNKYVLMVNRGSYDSIFKMCLVAHVLNKRKKVVPIILHHSDLTNKKKNIYKFFGIKKFYNLDKKLFAQSFIDVLNASFFLSFNNLENFIKRYSFRKLKIGDLIYDSYLRFKEDFYKPKKFSLSFIKSIYRATRIINIISYLFKNYKKNIRSVVLSQFCYANTSTLLGKYLEGKHSKIFTFRTKLL